MLKVNLNGRSSEFTEVMGYARLWILVKGDISGSSRGIFTTIQLLIQVVLAVICYFGWSERLLDSDGDAVIKQNVESMGVDCDLLFILSQGYWYLTGSGSKILRCDQRMPQIYIQGQEASL